MSRPKIDPVDRAVETVLNLTPMERMAFDSALRQVEKRTNPQTAPRERTATAGKRKTKPQVEAPSV